MSGRSSGSSSPVAPYLQVAPLAIVMIAMVGIPLATVLFGTSQMGIVVLPLMIFHQMQLMVCAVLARRYADRAEPTQAAEPARA